MSSFNTYINVTDQDGEHEIEVKISYDATYQAAYTSGLPEDCYPAESEMDLTEIEPISELPAGITQEMLAVAAVAEEDRITELAWDDYHSEN